jgi:hypothetical protein
MALHFWSLILLLGFAVQQAKQAPEATDVLTPAERSQMAKATKIDGRIKVYQAASERFKAKLANEMAKRDYSAVPDTLQLWAQLLKISLKDIDASITNRKKKSGALKNYEIRVRKSITDVQAYKTAVPVDVIDQFDTWLAQAEDVHQKFVDILFPK